MYLPFDLLLEYRIELGYYAGMLQAIRMIVLVMFGAVDCLQIDVLCMSYHFTVILVSYVILILYKFWCLRRILCHLYYDHIYTCASLFNVLFQCECHCFYSCRIIAVPQLRFIVIFVPDVK